MPNGGKRSVVSTDGLTANLTFRQSDAPPIRRLETTERFPPVVPGRKVREGSQQPAAMRIAIKAFASYKFARIATSR